MSETRSPAALPDAALEDAITTLAASIAAATAHLLALIAEFDRRERWGGTGMRSCAHWLNWKCGIALGAAREKVRVARALENLPAIRRAFSEGRLSYSKVRAMTRVATPENEDYLLMIARHGTAAHVEQAVRAYRRCNRLQAVAEANAVERARRCTWHYDEDGSLVLRARLPAEAGAMVLQALAAAADDLGTEAGAPSADVPAGTPSMQEDPDDPPAARRADALARLAETYLGGGGDCTSRSADRHLVVVHVDRDALRRAGPYRRAELDRGPAIAPDTARRIACDAATITVDEDADGEPLAIGRKSRTVPAALRRFLGARDRGCRFPGCTCHRHVDAHHVRHWADGGETRADNLVLLCRRHHRLVHEGGYAIERRDDGRWLFFTPGGALIPAVPPSKPAGEDIATVVARRGIDVSAGTPVPDWTGERMDVGMVVEGLLACDGAAL